MPESQTPRQNSGKGGWRSRFRFFKPDHDNYTLIDVIEQFTIMLGCLSFLVGFWYVVITLIISLIKRGA